MAKGDEKGSNRPSIHSSGSDLRRERDELLSHFTAGPRASDEIARHHEQLLRRIRQLEEENAILRARVEADDAIRELLDQIQRLEREKRELMSRTEEAEASSTEIGEQFQQFESEFANLANLFVASNQLHSSLSPRSVMRRIKDVLAQLVGAESYAVYMANSERTELVPVASEGMTAGELGPLRPEMDRLRVALDTGAIGVIDGANPSHGSLTEPAAVIPLSIEDRVVGLAVVYRTLAQKQRFDAVDFELFKLLGQHAATALVSASLFASADRRVPGLEAFMDLSV